MKEEPAVTLALQMLAQLSCDISTLERFLDEAGLDPADLNRRADDPELLGALLDFVLHNEKLLLEICGDLNLKPQDVVRARARLPGGVGDWA